MKKNLKYKNHIFLLLACHASFLFSSHHNRHIPNSIIGKVADSAVEYVQDMVMTADGKTVYVVNQFQDAISGYVSYFDVATNSMVGTVKDYDGSFYWPSAMAITPDGTKAYVANEGGSTNNNGSVSIIDLVVGSPTHNQVVGVVTDIEATLYDPYVIAITADGTRAYVLNEGDGYSNSSVSVIDVATNTIFQQILDDSFYNPVSMAITPDQTRAYVVNYGSGYYGNSVSVIDIVPTSGTYNQVIAVITDDSLYNSTYIAITSDGNYAYIANYAVEGDNGTVSIIDINPSNGTYNQVVNVITNGAFAYTTTITISPNGLYAYVTNDNLVTGPVLIIDLNPSSGTYNQVVASVNDSGEFFNYPSNVLFSLDGQTAYIPNWGGGINGTGVITIVDTTNALNANTTGLVNDKNLSEIYDGYYLAFTPDSKIAYVVNTDNYVINIVDVEKNAVIGAVNDPDYTLSDPYQIVVHPNGQYAYVANDGDPYTISIIDIATNTINNVITDESFDGTWILAITPDGSQLYVSNWSNNTISVVDTVTNTVTGVVSDINNTLNRVYALAMTPDGSTCYAVNYENNTISIIDVASATVTGLVSDPNNIFSDIYSIAISPNGNFAYVPSYYGGVNGHGSVAIIDLHQNLVVDTISDPNNSIYEPWAVAVSPDGLAVYVLNYNDGPGTISIIHPLHNEVVGVITNPLLNGGNGDYVSMLFAPNGSKMYIGGVSWITVMFAKNPIMPVTHFTGTSVIDRFLTAQNITNVLAWKAPISGVTPVQYNIYSDAALTKPVASIPALQGNDGAYIVNGLLAGTTYRYYIVAVDGDGNVSYPATITVTNK